jgi:hypothetical protein
MDFRACRKTTRHCRSVALSPPIDLTACGHFDCNGADMNSCMPDQTTAMLVSFPLLLRQVHGLNARIQTGPGKKVQSCCSTDWSPDRQAVVLAS